MFRCLQGLRLFSFLLLFTVTSINAEQKYDDSAALNGIDKAKGVFLIDFKTAKTTAFYMDLIVGTYDGFKRQGVEPEIVVVVIGPTVQFLSKEAKPELAFDYEESFDSIQQSIKALAKRNVRIEICAIATDVFDVDNEKLPQELDVVADGFISLIGWQTQGYKLVPVF